MLNNRKKRNVQNEYPQIDPIFSFTYPCEISPRNFYSTEPHIHKKGNHSERNNFEVSKYVNESKNKNRNNRKGEHNYHSISSSSQSKSKSKPKSKSNKRKRLADDSDDSDSSFEVKETRKKSKNVNDIVNIDIKTTTDLAEKESEDEKYFFNSVSTRLRSRTNRENDGDEFINYNNYIITIKELRLLKGDWLNDSLIDFFFHYFYTVSNLDDSFKKKIFIFSCHACQFLFNSKIDYEKLRKWLSSEDISGYDILVFPIILKSHWSLEIVLNCKKLASSSISDDYDFDESDDINIPIFLYMDSLGFGKGEFVSERISKFISKIYKKEDDNKIIDDEEKEMQKPFVYTAKMRKQDNWKDCGVFIISYFRHFLESPISYPYSINSIEKWIKDFNEKIATKEQRTDLRKILFRLYNEKHPGDEIPDEVDNIEEYKRKRKRKEEKEKINDEVDEIEVVFSEDEDKNKKNENNEDSLIEIDDSNNNQCIPIPLQPPPQLLHSPSSSPTENDVEIISSPPHQIHVDVDINDNNNSSIYDLEYMNYENEVDDNSTIQNTKNIKPEKEKYVILDITDN